MFGPVSSRRQSNLMLVSINMPITQLNLVLFVRQFHHKTISVLLRIDITTENNCEKFHLLPHGVLQQQVIFIAVPLTRKSKYNSFNVCFHPFTVLFSCKEI